MMDGMITNTMFFVLVGKQFLTNQPGRGIINMAFEEILEILIRGGNPTPLDKDERDFGLKEIK